MNGNIAYQSTAVLKHFLCTSDLYRMHYLSFILHTGCEVSLTPPGKCFPTMRLPLSEIDLQCPDLLPSLVGASGPGTAV